MSPSKGMGGQQLASRGTRLRSPVKAKQALPQLITTGSSNAPEMPQSPNAQRRAQDYLLIEEFNEEMDRKFLEEVVKPYFANIFTDIAQRRMSPRKGDDREEYVDNVAFFEYTNLPGIINDRFFATFDGYKDNQITKKSFVDGFCRVYLSSIEEKMKLTFHM
jgi:hypothetical protein